MDAICHVRDITVNFIGAMIFVMISAKWFKIKSLYSREHDILSMSKGGVIPKKTDGSTNHLFQSKWKLGKTASFRVPQVMLEQIKKLARHVDNNPDLLSESDSLVAKLTQQAELEKQNKILITKVQELEQELKFQKRISQDKLSQTKANKTKDKYRIAAECYQEYLDDNNLEISEIKLPRKGSVKRQLHDIGNWFQDRGKKPRSQKNDSSKAQ